MKDLMEVIKSRQSIRVYQDKPVPPKVVKDILEAAKYAPTARNMQELEYKVITDKALIDKLDEGIAAVCRKEGIPLKQAPGVKTDFFHGAPLLIIIIAPRDNMCGQIDAGLAIQNILLYATSIGLGSCVIGRVRDMERDKELLKLARIADDKAILVAVICGYPAESPALKEKKLAAEFFE